MSKAEKKSKSWTVKIWNCTPQEEAVCNATECAFLIYHRGTTKDGKSFLHGYIEFSEARDFTTVKNSLPRVFIEPAVATRAQNIAYHSRQKSFVMREGNAVKQSSEKKRTWKSLVVWLHGKTGTGKTTTAKKLAPNAWINHLEGLKWWDGYEEQEDVIIDNFNGTFCKFHELLRILDAGECVVPVKYGTRQLLAKRIIITCLYHPAESYKNVKDYDALLRRIDIVHEMRFDNQAETDKILERIDGVGKMVPKPEEKTTKPEKNDVWYIKDALVGLFRGLGRK